MKLKLVKTYTGYSGKELDRLGFSTPNALVGNTRLPLEFSIILRVCELRAVLDQLSEADDVLTVTAGNGETPLFTVVREHNKKI